MVRLVRESWARIEARQDEVAQFFYGMLFTLNPAARELFPINMEVAAQPLAAGPRAPRADDRPARTS